MVGVEVDNAISASTGKERPAWKRVLERVDAGEVDVIVAYQLDRITRTMLDLERLILSTQDKGVGVVTASGDIDLTTDSGRMVARILAAVARAEVERKGERQRLAERQRVSTGRRRWSHRPFGYIKEDASHHPVEAPALREVYARITRGQRLADVRDWLHEQELTTTAGNPWSVQTLRNLVLDPRNRGVIRYQGKEAGPGDWDPIVTEDEWANAVAVLRSRATGRRATKSDAWLVTVATCGQCQGRIFTEQRKTSSYRSYTCQKGCVHLPVDWVDGRVYLAIADALNDPGVAEQWRGKVRQDTGELEELRQELAPLRDRLAVLGEDYAVGLVSRETMLAATRTLGTRIGELEGRISELSASLSAAGLHVDAEHLAEQLSEWPVSETREALRSIASAIILHRRGKGSREGLTDRLVEVRLRGSESPDVHAEAV